MFPTEIMIMSGKMTSETSSAWILTESYQFSPTYTRGI